MKPKAKFTVALITKSWNGKMTLKIKGICNSRAEGDKLVKQLLSKCFGGNEPNYKVLGPVQLKKLQAKVQERTKLRRAEGAKKAAANRKKNGTKVKFILCPTCSSKSKVLRTEMGGLQTRRCTRGHYFEFDKWIADRAFWGPILGGGAPSKSSMFRRIAGY